MARDQHPLTPLEEALEAWEDTRDGLIAEVGNIPEDRFGFRPAPESRTVAELVRHILAPALLMTGELTRPDTDFRREPWPQLLALYDGPIRKASSKTDLIAALGGTFQESLRRFRELGEDGIQQSSALRREEGDQARLAAPRPGPRGVPPRPARGSTRRPWASSRRLTQLIKGG